MRSIQEEISFSYISVAASVFITTSPHYSSILSFHNTCSITLVVVPLSGIARSSPKAFSYNHSLKNITIRVNELGMCQKYRSSNSILSGEDNDNNTSAERLLLITGHHGNNAVTSPYWLPLSNLPATPTISLTHTLFHSRM